MVAFARSQLRAVVEDAMHSSLQALTQPRAAAKQLDAAAVGERLRDAVYRDRGLRAALAQSAHPPAACSGEGAPGAVHAPPTADDAAAYEPIRTRTMARLLAQQGAYARALRMYDAILEEDPDPRLQHEADALRATLANA